MPFYLPPFPLRIPFGLPNWVGWVLVALLVLGLLLWLGKIVMDNLKESGGMLPVVLVGLAFLALLAVIVLQSPFIKDFINRLFQPVFGK